MLFEAERWLAQDDTLARPVELCVLPADHPRAEAVVDAARQAAGVADQRLARVLDVGTEDRCTYVVTEWVDGDTVTELVRHGPLAADQARTLVGETALALEQARRRGLHHLLLSTDNVLRLDDGSVKVAGLAVDAALADLESTDPGEASRQDTFALVALAYAALTGFWPTSSTFRQPYDLAESGLPTAPDVAGSPVAPAQIVSGVPADLDTLCVQAFSGRGAPDTPGDLAGQIAPWGDRVRQERPTGAFPLSLPPMRHEVEEGGTRGAGTGAEPAGPRRSPPPSLPVAPAPAPAAPPARPDQPVEQRAAREQTGGPTRRAEGASPAAEAVSPTTAALPTPAADLDDPEGWGGLFDEPRERPAPLLPETPLSRPPGTQTRTVIIILIIFVAVMLALAKCGLSGLGTNAFVDKPEGSASPSSTATASGTATASATATASEPAPTETETSGEPLKIAAVSSFDPQGDGAEKESLADNAVDGDASTDWTSDAYKSASFSGLKKGVGLRLDLGQERTVHDVKVTVPAAGTDLELRTMSGNSLGDTRVVATAKNLDGTVTLTPNEPVTTRYLLLWFTQATEGEDGYRVAVSEVIVS